MNCNSCSSSKMWPTNGAAFNTLFLMVISVIFACFSLMGPLTAITDYIHSNYLLISSNNSNHLYVIFFDGGSTGTRSHIFTFANHSDGQLDLVSEEYHHVQPGLSSYADQPEKAAQSLISLLNKAKSAIPNSQWGSTPIVLKATAGLRLLPEKSAIDILTEVENLFAFSPFKYTPNSVSILDGTDEGIFAWQTVNLLLGHLNSLHDTVATLDLGGGSTQITFLPEEFETLMDSPSDHILETQISYKENKPLTLYTKSYLGFGLMSARLGTLLQSTLMPSKRDNQGRVTLQTPCFHPDSGREWVNNGTTYFVGGLESSTFGYHACNRQVKAYLANHIFSPREIHFQDIYALSYYYDRAVDAGIIEANAQARVLVEDFMLAAKKICSSENKEMFLCLDLTYITALLHEGLGLDYNKEIYLSKKIESVEASWVLGAAFQYLS